MVSRRFSKLFGRNHAIAMKASVATKLSPLAAWLILTAAVATIFPLKLEYLWSILITTTLLAMLWLPGRRIRSAPFLLLYIVTALLALSISLHLPTTLHPLAKLLLTLLAWGLILTIPLSGLIYYLLRTARTNNPRQDRR